MKRESLKMQEADFQRLQEVAAETSSLYCGEPSWRRLVKRIARGEIVCRLDGDAKPARGKSELKARTSRRWQDAINLPASRN